MSNPNYNAILAEALARQKRGPTADRIECAIRHIETSLDVDPWARDVAVSAMKKQLPKKWKVSVDSYVCPECGRDVEFQTMLGVDILFHGRYDFCPNCGQAIDWEGD